MIQIISRKISGRRQEGRLCDACERLADRALVAIRRIAVNAPSLHGLVDRGDKLLSSRRSLILLAALQCEPDLLEAILHCRECTTIDERAGGRLTSAFPNAEAIALIRKTNPNRTIFVGPSRWNQATELPLMLLPDDDENLIVTLHCYDPFFFTHQGASWISRSDSVTGIAFPGPPREPLEVPEGTKQDLQDWVARYNSLPKDQNPSSAKAFEPALQLAEKWSEYYGRPIHWGEFGAYTKSDDASRARYYEAFRRAAEAAGHGWAIWDWRAGFRYWDASKNAPAPGLREALFAR